MKPKWFYDIIGSFIQASPKKGLKAYDATLVDEVDLHIKIVRDILHVYDSMDYMASSSMVPEGPARVEVTVTDRPPGVNGEPRCSPHKILARPDSLELILKDMDNDLYRPYVLLQAMYIDYGGKQYVGRHGYSGKEYVPTWAFWEHWEPHDDWYLFNPVHVQYDDKHNVKDLAIR